MYIAGLIICAGKSERMGTNKAFLEIEGKTFLQNAIDKIQVKKVVVVTGFERERIEKAVKNALTVNNDNYEMGQFSSIRCGVKYIKDNFNPDGIILSMIDHPHVRKETVDKLLFEFSECDIVLPCREDKCGHPIVFGKKIIDMILSSADDSRLDKIIFDESNMIKKVSVSDQAVLENINKDFYP